MRSDIGCTLCTGNLLHSETQTRNPWPPRLVPLALAVEYQLVRVALKEPTADADAFDRGCLRMYYRHGGVRALNPYDAELEDDHG